jgi:transposase
MWAGHMGAESGDLTRVENPRALMTFLGLMPSAYPSAERRRQGAMTNAGNTHVHSALVEGAWASRSPAQGSRPLPRRRAQQPKMSQESSWKAQVRRCQRDRRLVSRGQHAPVVIVAIARALVGCMWAIATQVRLTASVHRTNRP